MSKILIIEDDFDMSQLLKRFLAKNGFEVHLAQNGKKGIVAFTENEPDIILCDLRLGDIEGTQVLREIKEINPTVPFIMMTGYSDIRTAVSILKMGAFDYLAKPLLPDEMLQTIKKALRNENSNIATDHQDSSIEEDKKVSARPAAVRSTGKSQLVFGKSEQSKELLRQIELVAPTNYSIIIYGESGAGKEAIAQSIHRKSQRAKQPFVAMDCGAISKELAGSELFGHEKGSFTGAVASKIGLFELANGGTIFLDEVANLPYDIQVSLLRIVQERKIKRVGGLKEIPIDVRIIVASNENLMDAYKSGKFREDLYHRFNEFHLTVPALRERKDDIIMYARFFLDAVNAELQKSVRGFTPEVENLFINYAWYGNLRELKNVIRRATLLSNSDWIEVKTLPSEIVNFRQEEQPVVASASDQPISTNLNIEPVVTNIIAKENPNLKSAALEAEYDVILKVLKDVNFNKSKAAKILNIDRKTLYNKIKAYNLDV
jgi:two-component system response regulator HydG